MRHQEERASPRHPVSVTAQCQGGETSAAVTLCNLSCHGCRLTTSKPVLVAEQRITIRIRGHDPLGAQVRWVIAASAGIVFDTPLCGPAFDQLLGLRQVSGQVMFDG